MFSDAVIYDTETSDADTHHGQVLEFGAVHADPRTLEETHVTEIDVRLLPYVVPSPEAMAICGFAPEDLCAASRLDETAAARAIAKVLRPRFQPKLQATWNGIKFDSQVLRTMMFRNLLDPWVTSGAKVRQLDVMMLARLGHFIDPSIVARGRRADGEPSWRLQDVAPANGFDLDAHRAVNDARATAAIMRLIRRRRAALFDLAVRRGDAQYMNSIASPAVGEVMYLFTSFGEPRLEPVLPLSNVRGQTVAARLAVDPAALLDGDAEAVAAGLFQAGGPCCAFKPNASPMLFTAAEAASIGLPVAPDGPVVARARLLRDSTAAETARRAQESLTYPAPANTPEARIYEKFASQTDKERAESFHAGLAGAASPVALIAIAQNISDLRMRELAARILLVHAGAVPAQFVEALGPERGRALEALGRRALARPHSGMDAGWMTVAQAESSDAATESYREWLRERYVAPENPVGTRSAVKADPEPPAASAAPQMSFNF